MLEWPTPTMLDLGRDQVAVYDLGSPAGSLGDVVLLHGMADMARSLEPLAASLRDRFRVILFDARGHGRSTHPGAYSVLHHVADLHAILDRLTIERPILIGHSLGGHTVANYSGLFPDRPRLIALLEGMGPPAELRPTHPTARLANGRAMVESLAAPTNHRPQPDLDAATDRLLATHPRLAPDRARVLAEEGTRPGPDGGLVWRHDERNWHWTTSIDQQALEERWAAITVPVLAISGAEAWDTWWTNIRGPGGKRTRLSAEAFEQRLAIFDDLTHVELAEAGHMVHFDQPDQVSELVGRFLADRLEPI
ncbi:MAG: alpha/beta hydrolase [Actinomycetota bacterium]